jgi:hypothetical protein
VSCSTNAWSPPNVVRPARFASFAATSKMVVPERLDAALVADQLGILGAECADRAGDQLAHDLVVRAEQAHVADRPAQDAPQDVAAALVAGRDAVADQHHAGADVVGDHAQGHVAGVVGAVALPGQLRRLVEDRAEAVGLVDVVDALQQGREPLQPEAGVDVLLGQVAQDRVVLLGRALAAQVLHEDEVPDFQVALAVDGGPARLAVVGAAVVVDLRARPARAGDAHRPEVLLHPEALDALGGHAHDPVPDVGRLVVVEVDRDPQLGFLEPETALGHGLGDQLPRQRNGQLLEIVTEGEVAAHLEERSVPRGLADLVDIDGADDLLHARRARERRRRDAQEVRLERHHPGVDQQQRRVVGDQRRRGHDGMPALLEEAEPTAADLC